MFYPSNLNFEGLADDGLAIYREKPEVKAQSNGAETIFYTDEDDEIDPVLKITFDQ